MAVEKSEEPDALMAKKTHKRPRLQRKLIVSDRVEVRSDEEGFYGSWHSGIVIACQERGLRDVRFDHLLTEDFSGNLIEAVRVSPVLDGVFCGNRSSYRGNIRPSPPPEIQFENWGIHYGMCVDAWYEEAWWEGVVFDHEDGSPERMVFFPDLGDEIKMGIDNLRITQDWDEVTGKWTRRGNWVLLEVVEEFEKECHLPVSVKQIWYDLRGKKGFIKNLKEWTCTVNHLWKKLVLDVIDGYLRFSAEVLAKRLAEFQELVDSDVFLPVDEPEYADMVVDHGTIDKDALELARPGFNVGTDLKALMHFGNSLRSGRVIDNGVSVQNAGEFSGGFADESLQSCDVTTGPSAAFQEPGMDPLASTVNCDASKVNLLIESYTSQQKEALCVVPQALAMLSANHDGSSTASSVSHGGKAILSNNSDKINGKSASPVRSNSGKWQPLSSERLPEAECCPNAINEYCDNFRGGKYKKLECRSAIKTDVWKHLVYLGWKIDSSCENRISRKRYTSPDGKCLYSLPQVFKHLKRSAGDRLSSASENDPRRLNALPSVSLPVKQPQQSQIPDCCPESMLFPSFTEDAKSDHCSHPVMVYYRLGCEGGKITRQLRSETMKQLSAAGWVVGEYYNPSGERKMNLYWSPTGKVYYSVRAACKVYLKEEGCTSTVSSVAKLSNFTELDEVNAQGVRRNPKRINAEFLNLRERRDRFRNDSKKGGKLSHRKDQSSTLLKVKKSKKLRAFISSRDGMDHTRPQRVLTSSKRVQEVVTLNSSHRNPRSILSWLIDHNKVLPRAKVYYYSRKEKRNIAEGRITRDGIKCSCCSKMFGITSFELHAGSICRKPSANILLKDGKSLLDCQKEIIHDLKMQSSRIESCGGVKSNWCRGENDYICSVCNYGGELLLCDQCPSSFHKSCLGLEDVPDGDWFCPSCCCGICGESKFQEDKEQINDEDILKCSQCERNYHVGCLRSRQPSQPGSCHMENWFCNEMCEKIFFNLQKLLGKLVDVGGESGDNLTWSLLKSTKTDSCCPDFIDTDALTENCSKLNVALGVMHECFEPVKDARTRRDLMEDILFNRRSDLKRLDFQGFYTVLLARNDELISVATVRVYGQKVAEVPLIGTRLQYRRCGMCRILMNELEKMLMELGVERLVLPAVPSVLNTWTSSFGFSQMTASERLQFLDYTFLDFQDTIMCQKQLKVPSAELSPSKGLGPKFRDDICQDGDNIDFDRSSAVSEVCQAYQIDDVRVMDQGQLEISAVHNSDSMTLLVEQRQNSLEGRPCVIETSGERSARDATLKRPYRFVFYPKWYKRRKKSTSGRLVNVC